MSELNENSQRDFRRFFYFIFSKSRVQTIYFLQLQTIFFSTVVAHRHLSNFELPSLHLLNRFLIYVILCHRRQCCAPLRILLSSVLWIPSRALLDDEFIFIRDEKL